MNFLRSSVGAAYAYCRESVISWLPGTSPSAIQPEELIARPEEPLQVVDVEELGTQSEDRKPVVHVRLSDEAQAVGGL